MIKGTPYIKIKNNGQIDYTSAHITEFKNQPIEGAAISYNTVIGVFINGYYLETAGVYSTTTATKHKPRAAAIAAYNNYKIIPNVKPKTLVKLYSTSDQETAQDILNQVLSESEEHREILQALYNNEETAQPVKHGIFKGTIKARRNPETKQYKNGNHQTKYFYRTNFKTIYNTVYEVNQKAIKTTVQTKRGKAAYNTYKTNIVNIGEALYS